MEFELRRVNITIEPNLIEVMVNGALDMEGFKTLLELCEERQVKMKGVEDE